MRAHDIESVLISLYDLFNRAFFAICVIKRRLTGLLCTRNGRKGVTRHILRHYFGIGLKGLQETCVRTVGIQAYVHTVPLMNISCQESAPCFTSLHYSAVKICPLLKVCSVLYQTHITDVIEAVQFPYSNFLELMNWLLCTKFLFSINELHFTTTNQIALPKRRGEGTLNKP
jgi:hypothetical protein